MSRVNVCVGVDFLYKIRVTAFVSKKSIVGSTLNNLYHIKAKLTKFAVQNEF